MNCKFVSELERDWHWNCSSHLKFHEGKNACSFWLIFVTNLHWMTPLCNHIVQSVFFLRRFMRCNCTNQFTGRNSANQLREEILWGDYVMLLSQRLPWTNYMKTLICKSFCGNIGQRPFLEVFTWRDYLKVLCEGFKLKVFVEYLRIGANQTKLLHWHWADYLIIAKRMCQNKELHWKIGINDCSICA